MAHIGAGDSYSRVQRDACFANVVTLCRQPGSCVGRELIMSLCVLRIGSVQDVMNLLADVLNALNEVVFLVKLRLDMGRICSSSRSI
jgi:hypothetical protein